MFVTVLVLEIPTLFNGSLVQRVPTPIKCTTRLKIIHDTENFYPILKHPYYPTVLMKNFNQNARENKTNIFVCLGPQ